MHLPVLLTTLSALLLPLVDALPQAQEAPICTDGGQLHCCTATFNGNNAPVALLTDLACYDLTPATTNCIITNGPLDPQRGCIGVWSCCQINLPPLLGLFCSEPPGECVGDEMPPRCLDVLSGRFGQCPAGKGLLGLPKGGGKKLLGIL